jgi:hypothetical protein
VDAEIIDGIGDESVFNIRPHTPRDNMSRMFKLILIAFGLWFELMLLISYQPYPRGEVLEVSYRQKERVAAMMDYRFHPSPTTNAKYQDELRLMHEHEDWKGHAALGFLVVVNVFGIYLLMRHGKENVSS